MINDFGFELRLSSFTNTDFEHAILPIKELPLSDDLMARFPLLNKLDGFDYDFEEWPDRRLAKNYWIRYIVLFYSKGITILEEKYPEYLTRKTACAILAGFSFNKSTGKFDEKVEDALLGNNPQCNRMIISLIKHNYADEFTTYRLMRDKHFRFMLDDDTGNAKDTKTIIETTKILEDFRRQFLNGDKNEKINASLVQHIEEVSLGIRAEEVAKRIKDGNPPIDFECYN